MNTDFIIASVAVAGLLILTFLVLRPVPAGVEMTDDRRRSLIRAGREQDERMGVA